MPKKKNPGEKWFERPTVRCKLCGAGLGDAVAAEQHFAGACSGLQAQGTAGKTEELQCFEAQDETQVFRLTFLAKPTATFADLDGELRRLWLECCGHCSQFAVLRRPQPNIIPQDPVAGVFFFGEEPQELRIISSMPPEDDDRDEWRPQDREQLSARLSQPRLIAQHSYDFGTTTSTLVVAGAKFSVPASAAARLFAGGRRLALVARNERPQIPCCECGKPAKLVLNEGSNFSDKGYADFWCSRACAKRSGADMEMVDRFFNSPRSGVCGYEGPLDAEEGEEGAAGQSEEDEESSSIEGEEGSEEEGSEEEDSEDKEAEEQPAARRSGRGGAAAGARGRAAAKPAARAAKGAAKPSPRKAAAKPAAAKKAAAGKKPAAAKKAAAGKAAAAKPAATKAKAAGGKRKAATAAASTRSSKRAAK